MSVETQAALAEFERAMHDPRNLVEIHKALNPNRGRRWAEPTINRGIVVLTVAAWQAFVEDLTIAVLYTMRRNVAGQPNLAGQFQLVEAASRNAVHRLNTPMCSMCSARLLMSDSTRSRIHVALRNLDDHGTRRRQPNR